VNAIPQKKRHTKPRIKLLNGFTHWSTEVAPATVNWLFEQAVHVAVPGLPANDPTGHSEHVAEPLTENEPAGHALQLMESAPDMVPPGQFVHVKLPSPVKT
jgi:hypothetical protein